MAAAPATFPASFPAATAPSEHIATKDTLSGPCCEPSTTAPPGPQPREEALGRRPERLRVAPVHPGHQPFGALRPPPEGFCAQQQGGALSDGERGAEGGDLLGGVAEVRLEGGDAGRELVGGAAEGGAQAADDGVLCTSEWGANGWNIG